MDYYTKWTVQHQTGFQKVSEYDQEIPQSHTAVQPTTPSGRATEHL